MFSGSPHRQLRSNTRNEPEAEVEKYPLRTRSSQQQLPRQQASPPSDNPAPRQPAPTATVADDEIGAGKSFKNNL